MEELQNKINAIYQVSKNYPDLVRGLVSIGILSYTVDVTSGIIFYRSSGGENLFHASEGTYREVANKFGKEICIQAVKDTQQGKTTYPEFLDQIAKAGVRFYEATLNGERKRVTYIGSGGFYEELIPN